MPALLIACFFLLILFICIIYLIISESSEAFNDLPSAPSAPLAPSADLDEDEETLEDLEPDTDVSGSDIPGYEARDISGSDFTTMGPQSPKYGYIYKKQDETITSPVGTLAPTIEFIAPLILDEKGNMKFPFYNAPSSAPK